MIEIDTKKAKECGDELIKITTQIQAEIDNLYLRISEVPAQTKEWVGETSERFCKEVYKSKTELDEFNLELKKLGKKILDNSNNYDIAISKVANTGDIK